MISCEMKFRLTICTDLILYKLNIFSAGFYRGRELAQNIILFQSFVVLKMLTVVSFAFKLQKYGYLPVNVSIAVFLR